MQQTWQLDQHLVFDSRVETPNVTERVCTHVVSQAVTWWCFCSSNYFVRISTAVKAIVLFVLGGLDYTLIARILAIYGVTGCLCLTAPRWCFEGSHSGSAALPSQHWTAAGRQASTTRGSGWSHDSGRHRAKLTRWLIFSSYFAWIPMRYFTVKFRSKFSTSGTTVIMIDKRNLQKNL